MFAIFPPALIWTSRHLFQGELEHRRVKQFYKHTNKSVSFPHQIAKQERMQRHYRQYMEALKNDLQATEQLGRNEPTGVGSRNSPTRHYSISDRSQGHLKLYPWALDTNLGDPALKVRQPQQFLRRMSLIVFQDFIPNLKDHLLARILHRQYDPEPLSFTDYDRNRVQIVGKRLEQRYTMTINYTTYDLQRGSDKINMKGRPYVIALSHSDPSHPYVYARVLGIHRVKVLHPTMAAPTKMDILWVRWLQIDRTHHAGWKAKRLYRVQFVPNLEDGAFGFLDPDDIVRGAHIIPCFEKGLIVDPPVASVSKWDYAPNVNWQYYYINQ